MLNLTWLVALVVSSGMNRAEPLAKSQILVFYASCRSDGTSPATSTTIQSFFDVTTAVRGSVKSFEKVLNSHRMATSYASLNSVWLAVIEPSGERYFVDTTNTVCHFAATKHAHAEYWKITDQQIKAVRHDVLVSFPENLPDGVGVDGLTREFGGP